MKGPASVLAGMILGPGEGVLHIAAGELPFL